MNIQLEIQLIAILISMSCSLLGVFLVLRKMSMMTDAISHSILLGIVLAYLVTKDLSSPFIIISGAIVGLVSVVLIEGLKNTRLVSEDAAIGIVFPLFFSIGIILINLFTKSINLDVDSVLSGEITFTPFNRLVVSGIDLGPKSIYIMGLVFIINLTYVLAFFKELSLVSFDEVYAITIGISTTFINYSLMSLVSITTVAAFESVGSILVIAFMTGPPATAYLISRDLKDMIIKSILIGIVNVILGYQLARIFDLSISGMMASITGLVFFIVFIFSPKTGLITSIRNKKKLEAKFLEDSLLFHIYNYEGTFREDYENQYNTIKEHFNWEKDVLDRLVSRLIKENMVYIKEDTVKLTKKGRDYVNINMGK